MSESILVTYATKYGSTQEVAEAIAAALREGGRTVDLKPMREVKALDGWAAVVMGAPIYIGRWHKDGHRFLARHQTALTGRKLALFALGPTGTSDEEMAGARQQLAENLAEYTWLQPGAQEVFIGKYDPKALRFPDNLLGLLPASPLHGKPASDHRDWDAIRAWAEGLPAQLGL